MSPKRLTRKEIKEDPIQEVLTQVYDGLARNTKFIVGAVVALVLVFAGVYLWQHFSSGRHDQLQAQFADALEIYHAPLESEAADLEEKPKLQFKTAEERNQKALEAFSALASEYPDEKIGLYARYYGALILQDQGEGEKAASELEAVISKSPQGEVAALARNHLAYVYLTQGKNSQAIDLWKKMLDSPADKFPRDGVLLSLARAYEQEGNKEEALKQYRKLVAEFPQNPNARQAQSRIDLLEAEVGAAEETPKAAETAPKESGA